MDQIKKDDNVGASIAIAAIKYIRIYFNLKNTEKIFKQSDDVLKDLTYKEAEYFEDFYSSFLYFYPKEAEIEFNNIRTNISNGKIQTINEAMYSVKDIFVKYCVKL